MYSKGLRSISQLQHWQRKEFFHQEDIFNQLNLEASEAEC